MTGASLPKRALSASATCPAGTIGIGAAAGAGAFGAICGDCDGASTRPPGLKTPPRMSDPGAIVPIDGVAENSELDCAKAALGMAALQPSRASRSTNAGLSRVGAAAIAGALLMTLSFSAQIAAISSQLTGFVTLEPLC